MKSTGSADAHDSNAAALESACLIVEDHPRVAACIRRIAKPIVGTITATTVEEGLEAVASDALLCGLVADLALPDGSGLAVVEAFRKKYPTHPAVVVTGALDRTLINRVGELGAGYVCKPDVQQNLEQFFSTLSANKLDGSSQKAVKIISRFARQYGLTAREEQIVRLAADGVPRARLAELLGVSESTVKSQVRSLLRKTHCNRVSEVVWAARRGSGIVRRFKD